MFLFLARLRECNLKEEWVGEELSIEAYSGRQKKKKKERKKKGKIPRGSLAKYGKLSEKTFFFSP